MPDTTPHPTRTGLLTPERLLLAIAVLLVLLPQIVEAQDYGGRPPWAWPTSSWSTEAGGTRISLEVKPRTTTTWLARRFGVSAERIRAWNRLGAGERLEPGEQVVLYLTPEALPRHMRRVVHVASPGETFASVAEQHGVGVGDLISWNWRLSRDVLLPGSALFVYLSDGRARDRHFPGATQLPEGPGYVVRNPERAWGSAAMIATLTEAFAAMAERYPEAPPLHIGDLSRAEGGFLTPHVSHRAGRDVDIAYYTTSEGTSRRFAPVTPATLDAEKTWALMERLLASGRVRMMFVDYELQRPLMEEARRVGVDEARLQRLLQYPAGRFGGGGIIHHWPGHGDHVHVRVW